MYENPGIKTPSVSYRVSVLNVLHGKVESFEHNISLLEKTNVAEYLVCLT